MFLINNQKMYLNNALPSDKVNLNIRLQCLVVIFIWICSTLKCLYLCWLYLKYLFAEALQVPNIIYLDFLCIFTRISDRDVFSKLFLVLSLALFHNHF